MRKPSFVGSKAMYAQLLICIPYHKAAKSNFCAHPQAKTLQRTVERRARAEEGLQEVHERAPIDWPAAVGVRAAAPGPGGPAGRELPLDVSSLIRAPCARPRLPGATAHRYTVTYMLTVQELLADSFCWIFPRLFECLAPVPDCRARQRSNTSLHVKSQCASCAHARTCWLMESYGTACMPSGPTSGFSAARGWRRASAG